jgi:hypothetical protein
MKNIFKVFLVLAMFFSVVFVFETTDTSAQVTVKKKRTGGVVGATTRGAKYVYRKGAQGTRYVYRKGKQGTVYVGKQTYRGGKWTYNKSKSGVKKGYSATKKVLVGN